MHKNTQQKARYQKTGLIRVNIDVKHFLEELKFVEGESYNEVIERLIQSKLEDFMRVNEQTKKVLKERLNFVRDGKAFPDTELFERIHLKRGHTKEANELQDNFQ